MKREKFNIALIVFWILAISPAVIFWTKQTHTIRTYEEELRKQQDIYSIVEQEAVQDYEYYSYITITDDDGTENTYVGFLKFKGVGDCPEPLLIDFQTLRYYTSEHDD